MCESLYPWTGDARFRHAEPGRRRAVQIPLVLWGDCLTGTEGEEALRRCALGTSFSCPMSLGAFPSNPPCIELMKWHPHNLHTLDLVQTVDRFKTQLQGFSQAPWTLQRLCEVILEPHRQYKLLHKVGIVDLIVVKAEEDV